MARIQVKAQSATLEFFVGENLCPFVTRYQYNNLELRPTHLINSDLGENLSPRHFLPSKPSSFQALQFFAPFPLSTLLRGRKTTPKGLLSVSYNRPLIYFACQNIDPNTH
ncbi:unnamed protein product, partial [Vitis vinifera]